MRRIKLEVEYDGSAFSGFQRLPEGEHRSVQAELEAVLSRLLDRETLVKAAGRTDAGVHATGQVVAFDTPSARSLAALVKGSNALLPACVRVVSADEVAPDFHPRFSARSRLYQYYVVPSDRPDAFFQNRVWWLRRRLELEPMRKAARALLGRHDFSAYCSRVPREESRIRELQRLEVDTAPAGLLPGPWQRLQPLVRFELEADAFLRRMVRMLVAALVNVGTGEWEPDRPAEILRSRDPGQSAPPAPPGGLYLVKVRY